jgi:hypothetical protein
MLDVFKTRTSSVQISEFNQEEMLVEFKIFVNETDVNILTINGKAEKIIHKCNLFPEKAKLTGKFCHHIGIAFRKLKETNPEFALELIHRLSLRSLAWTFSIL